MPSGCAIGAEIPSFFVREVTGSRPNQAICLVCRYGARPTVLVCVRKLNSRVKELLIGVDRIVDSNRGVGLRGFAIFIGAEPRKVQPKLFTLARRKKLSLPLVIPVESGGPRSLDLPKDAQVTVLFYRRKKIVRRFVFQPDALDREKVQSVISAAAKLVKADDVKTNR